MSASADCIHGSAEVPPAGVGLRSARHPEHTLLPALFQGTKSQIPRREITVLPVKQAGISLLGPTQTAGENWTAFCVIRGHFVAALRGMAKFRSWDHDLLMGEVNEEIRQKHVEAAETALGEYQSAASKPDARRMGSIQKKGA